MKLFRCAVGAPTHGSHPPIRCVSLLIERLRVDGGVRVLLLGPERARTASP